MKPIHVSKERREQILRDIAIPLVNDPKWYAAVKLSIEDEDFEEFRLKTNQFRESNKAAYKPYPVTSTECQWLNMYAWEYHMGTLTKHHVRECDRMGDYVLYAEENPSQPPLKESLEMNPTTQTAPTVAFQTKHLVFGVSVEHMSEDQLIEAIQKVEGEITNLKGVKTKSTRITAKVKELEEMLAKIVGVLDAK